MFTSKGISRENKGETGREKTKDYREDKID